MTDKIISIKITSDGKAFVSDMAGNASSAAAFDKQLKTVGDDLDAFISKTTGAGAATKGAAAAVSSAATTATAASRGLKGAGDEAEKSAKKLKGIGDQAQRTAQQMRQVAPQFTDIVTQLSAGASPLQVLIQQGGQLKDVFGGVGPAVKAVGGYVAALITPTSLAVGALGALAFAYFEAQSQDKALRDQILLTGNAAGVTASRYKEMSAGLVAIGSTRGAAVEALLEMAAGGTVAADNLQRFTQLAMQMDRTVGKPVQDTAREFDALGRTPVEASQKLNEAYNYLTASVYRQIKALQDQGDTVAAANLAQTAFFDAMSSRMPEAEKNLGTLERLWLKVWGAVKGTAGAVVDAFKTPSLDAQIAKVQHDIGLANADPSKVGGWTVAAAKEQLAANQKLLAQLQQQKQLEEGNARAAAQRAESTKAAERYAAQGNQYLPTHVRLQQEISKAIRDGLAAGESYADVMERVKQIKKQIVDQDVKDAAEIRQQAIEAQGQIEASQVKENIDRINQLYKLGAVSEAQYIDMVGALEVKLLQDDKLRLEQRLAIARTEQNSEREVADLKQQIALKDESIAARKRKIDQDQIARYENLTAAVNKFIDAQAAQDEQDTRQAEADAYNRYMAAMQAVNDYIKSLRLESDELQFQIGLLGKNAYEQQRLNELHRIDLKMQQQLDELQKRAAGGNLTAGQVAAEEARIRSAAASAAANVDTKIWADEWKRANDEVGDSLYDVLTGRARQARDRMKSLFEQLVLRPLVQPVLGQISGAIANLLVGGGPGGAAAGAGAINGLGSIAGMAGLFGSGGLSGALLGGAGWLTGATSLGGALGAASSLIGTGTGAGIASGLAMGAGALAPIALGAYALYSAFDKHGGPKTESGYGTGVPLRGDASAATAVAQSIAQPFTAAAQALGISADKIQSFIDSIGVFIAEDPKGTAKTQLQVIAGSYNRGTLTGGGPLGENVSRDSGALQDAEKLAIAQAIIKGLQDSAQGKIGDFFRSIDITSASLDTLQKAIQIGTDVGTLEKALQSLPFTDIADLSVDAQSKLIDFSGGLQNLTQNLASYAQNFYSSDEQRAATLNAIQSQLASVGLSLNGIDTSSANARAQFRQLVDSIDATTEAGQQQRAMLYALAPAFASVTQELKNVGDVIGDLSTASTNVENAKAAIRSFGEQLQATFDNIQSQINQVRGQAVAAVKTAQADLTSALQGVADAIKAAAQNVAAAKEQVTAARDQITQGYLAALDAEKQVKQQITQAYLKAQDDVTAAQQRLTDAQEAAARALRNAGDSIMDTLRQLAGTNAGSGSILEQYKNLKNQLSYLAARAQGGDAQAAGQLGQVAQQFLGVSRQANTAQGFTADDIFVRQLLARVVAVTGTNAGQPGDAQDAISKAQEQLAAAIAKANELQQLAIKSGASLTDSNEDLAAQLAAAVTEVAKWSAAVAASGASKTAPDQVTQAVNAYKDALKGLTDAQRSQTALLQATASVDFSSLTTYTYDWEAAVAALTKAQTDLSQAQSDAAAVNADLYDQGKGLVGQYIDLQAKLTDANTALQTFATQVAGLDLTSGVNQLFDLITNLRNALGEQSSASSALAGTAVGQQVTGIYQQLLGRAPDAQGLAYWANLITTQGYTTQDVISGITNSAEYRAKYAGTGDIGAIASVLASFDGSDAAWKGLYDAAIAAHVSSAQVEQALQLPQGAAVNWAIGHNLPAFATGTMYVQDDGPAILHRGEMVVPARFNPAVFRNLGSANDPALSNEMRRTRTELRAGMESMALNMSRLYTMFQAMKSPQGDALQVRQPAGVVFEVSP